MTADRLVGSPGNGLGLPGRTELMNDKKNILLANNEWIEVSPTIKVSGPSHKVVLAGVVSNQPENDAEDIRIEDDQKRIFIRRRNDREEDRVFTLTYRVNVHGAEYFINKQVITRKPAHPQA